MDVLIDIIALLCSIGFVVRMRQYFAVARNRSFSGVSARTSIIIPARNEERNLPALLHSLKAMSFDPLEIIVVDDHSTDATSAIARKFGAKVLPAGQRPEGWTGKNWACYVGAREAMGDYLLFTDADTIHSQESLAFALNFMKKENADMISALPYHLNKLWWEKMLGPFYSLVYCGGSIFDKQSSENAYAIGQYMLFDSAIYHQLGGHFSVKSEVAEDAALAKKVMNEGHHYAVYQGEALYCVQMYSSFKEFRHGWVRLIRLGMNKLSPKIILNVMMPLVALNAGRILTGSALALVPIAVTLLCFIIVQKRIGCFSLAGIIFFPVPILLFIVLSFRAIIEEMMARPIFWKGRAYFGT